MQYEILNHETHKIQFIAEIDCDDNASAGAKKGWAVKWAIKNNVDLRGTDLFGVNLTNTKLRGVNLSSARLDGVILNGATF